MLIEDIIEAVAMGRMDPEHAAGVAIGALDPAEHEIEPLERGHHPFKHPQAQQHGYLGPGPAGMIHIPSKRPWRCKCANYECRCERKRMDGGVQVKINRYDPERVKTRNLKYRPFRTQRNREERAGIRPPPDPISIALRKHAVLRFASHY